MAYERRTQRRNILLPVIIDEIRQHEKMDALCVIVYYLDDSWRVLLPNNVR